MDDETTYVLTMYNNGRKVGRMTNKDRRLLQERQRQWDQASDCHTSVIDEQPALQNERLGEIAPGEYLTQSGSRPV